MDADLEDLQKPADACTREASCKAQAHFSNCKSMPSRPVADELLIAVGKWVESEGGKVLVAGGISIMRQPGDDESTFYVRVKCTGIAPELKRELYR